MIGLLEQLGVEVDVDGIQYPRIPAALTPPTLVNMAAQIGDLTKGWYMILIKNSIESIFCFTVITPCFQTPFVLG